jgi:hypothetical protein
MEWSYFNGVQTDDLKLLVENGGDYWQVCFCTVAYAFISKHFRTCNCSHFVEPLLGRKNYFILYILSGLWTLQVFGGIQ